MWKSENCLQEGGLKSVLRARWEVVKVLHTKYWDGMRDVWKKRPRDVYLWCWWPNRGDRKCISLAPFTRVHSAVWLGLSLSTSPAYRYWLCFCLYVCLFVRSLSLWQTLLTSSLESYIARFMSENIRPIIHTALIYPQFFIRMKIGLLLCVKTIYSTCFRMCS